MERIRIYLFVLLFVLSAAATGISGCASHAPSVEPEEPISQLLLDTAPRDRVPVFLGYSPRLKDRAAEKESAIDAAAEQALRYLEVRAATVLISQRSNGDVGYARAVETREPEDRLEEIREELDVIHVVQDRRGTAVLVWAPELPKLHAPIPTTVTDGSERPSWMQRPPEIDGYAVGVGVAQRRRNLADSIAAVDEDALADIILEDASEVRVVENLRSTDGTGVGVGAAQSTTRAETATAVVRGFYVISRRVGPEGRYHYALAVARQVATPEAAQAKEDDEETSDEQGDDEHYDQPNTTEQNGE